MYKTWPGLAWHGLASFGLSNIIICLVQNVSRDAIETKTHEVLKSWELKNKEFCLHHTTGIKRWNFPEHSILFYSCLTHLGPTWFECVCTLNITIICWMTQSSINNVTVYQGIMPILFGNTNLTNVCQWCGRLKQLTYFKEIGVCKRYLTLFATTQEKRKINHFHHSIV